LNNVKVFELKQSNSTFR